MQEYICSTVSDLTSDIFLFDNNVSLFMINHTKLRKVKLKQSLRITWNIRKIWNRDNKNNL